MSQDYRPRYEFASHLEALENKPIEAMDSLKTGLRLDDLDVRLGLTHELATHEPEELSYGAIQTVEVVRQLVMFFSRYGVLDVDRQGSWLANPHPTRKLWWADEVRSPLYVLNIDALQNGPHKDNIWRVTNAARNFCNPVGHAHGALMKLINSGSGDFMIYSRRHDGKGKD